jgi:hypothetical protein
MATKKRRVEKRWPVVEQREHERFVYVRPIRYREMGQPGLPSHPKTIAGKLIDLSNSGMQIAVSHGPLTAGMIAETHLPVMDAPVTVPVLSKVKWVKAVGPKSWTAGLLFLLDNE